MGGTLALAPPLRPRLCYDGADSQNLLPTVTLQELKYIVAVAEEKHFGRAAERSFVSQPSLSAAIRNLEDELGVKVFERKSGGVLLTDAGERVVEQARRVLEEAARVKSIAKSGRNPLAGVLRLGVIPTIAPYVLPDLVQALRVAAPQMPLDIEENLTANLEAMLRGGTVDAAILALPFEVPGIETQALYDEDFQLVVPAKHPWAKRKRVALGELKPVDLLLLPVGHCFRDQVLDACGEFARAPAPGRQGNSLETLRSMVASGLGMTVLPATALTSRQVQPLVKALPFDEPRPMRRIAIAWRSGFPRMAALRVVGEAARGLKLPINATAG
jgi:LysR family transcriptional regulator, hydrogen peroxide-inducible genes activator